MTQFKQSDRIRELVEERYVRPALNAGNVRLSIRVRDVLKDAEATADFPRGRTPLICEVLQGKKLLNKHGLMIESVDGPQSKQSRTVVVHYRFVGPVDAVVDGSNLVEETAADWTERVTNKLNGLLRKEIAAYGGADALMKWMRQDEGEDAA